MNLKLPSLLLASLLLTSCGTTMVNPVTGQTERSVMSEADEVAEGAKAHQEVLKEYGVYNNAAVQRYVTNLGLALAAQSHRSQLEWYFTVLDSPEINAFALPGGYVYVTRGIMAYMDSEADLAGVIGHEIGHVTARHGAQRATSQQNAGLGVMAASVLGLLLETQGVSGAGRLASEASQTVAAGYIASYGRDQELQADGLGAEYLARTHYDPRNMVDVINVLKNQERFAADQAKAEGRPVPTGSDWLASHPSNDQRLQAITALAAQYKSDSKYNDDGRERYLKIISGMTFGDSPAQGLTRGRNFYHEPLGIAITAPTGWYIQNDADQLALLNTARDAAVVVRVVPAKAGKTHADVMRSLFKLSQSFVEETTLNGLAATRFNGVGAASNGQVRPVEATVVTGPNGTMYLLQPSAKDARALERARAQIRAVEGSFRALTAQDRAAAKPWGIKTAPYPRGGFAELAKTSPIAQPEQQLRLINGYYGGGEPKLGQLVKVVTTF
jgi:predicted Zn-dependent protease